MNFYIYTLGCKVNQYESEYMAACLEKSGYSRVTDENADIIIINSCTVTNTGDNKALKYLRHSRRENLHSIIILTGCMPQAFPELLDSYTEADIVLGNSSRKRVVSALEEFYIKKDRIVDIGTHKTDEQFESMEIDCFEERTRAFVKIEDGCNRFCSYCIIPYARGRVRSKPLDSLKKELAQIGANGYKEVVLVGINLSAYGQEFGLQLCDAVELACNTDGIERVRLGSIEPERMDAESVARLAALPQFCPQFHLSLQSGSTTVLKRMNRHYDANEYLSIVDNIKKNFDNPAITTDIMVGFPGESEDEFNECIDFATQVGFAKVHVFAYSRRKGTVADKMDNQVDNGIKKKRASAMIEHTSKLRKNFLCQQHGRVEEVLVERMKKTGECEGYTKNYTPVRFKSNTDLCGKLVTVKITSSDDDCCYAELI